MALLRWILGFAISIALACFAAMNTQDVPLRFSPFNELINIPLYAAILGSVCFGFVFGGALVWMNGGKVRKERRRLKKEIKILEKQLEHTKSVGMDNSHVPELQTLPARDAA